MSAPIGAGDWVECRPLFWQPKPSFVSLTGPWPSPGAIYQVRETGFLYGTVEPGIRLAGTVCGYGAFADVWWPTKHFRPIYRPDESLTRRLMEPLPDAIAPSSEPVSGPQPRDPQVVRAWSREEI